MKKLLEKLPTPFFLLDKGFLRVEIRKIKDAFELNWNNYEIGYSVKTNSFPPLAEYLKDLDVAAEVVSFDEYQMVKSLGYSSLKLICNGPIKPKEWLDEIFDKGHIINIDSLFEVDYLMSLAKANPSKEYRIGIRVNLNIEAVFSDEMNTCDGGSRFGFSYERGDLNDVLLQLGEYSNILIVGLHFHINSNSRTLNIYKWLALKFVEISISLNLRDLNYVDFGGGFFGGVPNKPIWSDYISAISGVLEEGGFTPATLRIIIEPGVSLLAGSLKYYTRICDIRENMYQTTAILDGSRIHIDPFFHKQKNQFFYTIFSPKVLKSKSYSKVCLTGYTCLEKDRFFVEEGTVSVGDYIIFEKVGAYTMTLSPLFISYFPAVYTISAEGEIICLREKWTYKEFMQLSRI